MSITYLQAQAYSLNQQLGQVPANSVEWQQLRNQLLTVRAQLGQARGAIQNLTF